MITQLTNRALLKISGRDSNNFLQAQLANDISKLIENQVQLSAYCQHQGRVVVLFWVFKKDNYFYLSLPLDLVDIAVKRLTMFIIMADVVISDVSNDIIQLGIIDEVTSSSFVLNNRQSITLVAKSKLKKYKLAAINIWQELSINMQIPEVSLVTSGVFIPQMLNLDINELGLSFTKGCYPGQEVVARLHYLGKAKKRMFIFNVYGKVNVGDILMVSSRKTGVVVCSVKLTNQSICLATIDIKNLDEKISLNSNDGIKLEKIN